MTTSRPIPGKVPKKAVQKGSSLGNTSGKQTEYPSRRTRASKIQKQVAPTTRLSQASPEEFYSVSSVDSDDTIMREIDEVAGLRRKGRKGTPLQQ